MSKSKASPQSYFIRSGIKEVKLLRKHFQIKGVGEKVKFSKEISPNDIRNFYKEYLASIRPPNLGSEKIVPSPDRNALRALYVGSPDVNTLLNVIIRHALYVDQIIITDPFLDRFMIDGDKGVMNHPEIWGQVIANKALCLCALEDWIEKGIVLIYPNFVYYFPNIIDQTKKAMVASGFKLTQSQQKQQEQYLITRFLVGEEPESRENILKVFERMGKQFKDGEKQQLLETVNKYENKNPIRFRVSSSYYEKHFSDSKHMGQIVKFSLGIPIQLAYPLADIMGAFLIFENEVDYEIITKFFGTIGSHHKSFEELALAFQDLDFPFLHNVSLKVALEIREGGYLRNFRIYLRDLWSAIGSEEKRPFDDSVFIFKDRLKAEYFELKHEWEQIKKILRLDASSSGLAIGLLAIASGSIQLVGLSASVIKSLKDYKAIATNIADLERKPLAVFMKLTK